MKPDTLAHTEQLDLFFKSDLIDNIVTGDTRIQHSDNAREPRRMPGRAWRALWWVPGMLVLLAWCVWCVL